jgi:epothilone polyketide synthase D
MSDQTSNLLNALRNAAKEVERLRGEKQSLVDSLTESIAIVGMGCRFPGGVTDQESFWRLLDEGRDAITEVPRARWDIDATYDPDPDAPGKMTTRSGGFVSDIDLFDPAFFGISPREATSMDPQQRLLLETSWEAIERAGLLPERLMNSDTGVFVGLMYHDYAGLTGDLEALDGYFATGNTGSVASGRISYVLGLKGPSITLDTACSSSLVTVHLACQALRQGECSMALAGGVALMLSPASFVEFSRLRGLAPDGRCKSFSAAADGVAWAEGCGMLVLKRLRDAERDGDPILAVIRGSAVNQDGRSNGLTAPNGPSQQAVIRRALAQAGVSPSEVDYVECHGTGTSLGDPIEVQALGAVMAAGRTPERPVVIGSAKSNIGHAQSAAGVAGIMKVVLALQHGRIPKNLHFDEPSPHIAWSELPVKVASEEVEWPRTGMPRRAGVSSFGISGTNAHIVLEEAPVTKVAPAPPERSAQLVMLSAKSAKALDAQAERLRDHLEAHPEQGLGDIAFSLMTTRSPMEHRLAVAVASREGLRMALDAAAQGQTPPGMVRGTTASSRGKLAFLFTGQGAQVLGMGRALCAEWPAFRETFDRCVALFDRELDRPLREVMWAELGSAEAALLDQTEFTQPALFAVEYALAALWRSWGVEPELVAGHSIGELVAACVAGVFSLEDAVRLVAARGRLMQALPAGGAMVSIAAPEAEVADAVTPHAAWVSIAAVNGPEQVVIAGAEEPVQTITAAFTARGVRTKALRVSHAFHSPLMQPMLEAFGRVAASVTYHPPSMALVSNLSGKLATDQVSTPGYWVRHVREAVRFEDGVKALHEAGSGTFLEVGPRPTLLGLIPACLSDGQPELIASLRAGRDESASMLEALGGLWSGGRPVDGASLFPAGGRRVSLPTYAWQRERYWIEQTTSAEPLLVRPAASGVQVAEVFHEGWIWDVKWRRQERVTSPGSTAGAWLVLSDRGGTGETLARLLRAQGTSCVRVVAGRTLQQIEPGLWEIDPGDPEGYRLLLREAFSEGTPCRGVVHLFGLDAPRPDSMTAETLARSQILGSESALLLSQALLLADFPDAAQLWLVSRGAVATGGENGLSVAQAPMWGFGRTLQGEHPELGCTLVDLSLEPSDAEIAELASELFGRGAEDQIALRPNGRFVARLAPTGLQSRAREAARLRADVSYLVTGGLGGLGLAVAEWMVAQGARYLMLVGRRAPSEAAREAIARMEEAGASILVAGADASRKADVDALLVRIGADLPPLRGVVHAAGILQDRTVLELSVEAMREVAAPKVQGAWNLHEATIERGIELDFFVLYASAASILGSPGQGNYAAANAFLDALAHDRRARGLPGLSIDWGPFSQVGLAAAQADRGERLAAMGFRHITPAEGNQVLGALLDGSLAQVGIMPMDVERVAASIHRIATAPYFSEVVHGAERGRLKKAEPHLGLDALRGAPPEKQRELLERLIQEALAHVMRLNPAQLDRRGTFHSYGFDSLMSLELRNRLQAALGLKLSIADIITHPQIDQLAEFLAPRFAPILETQPAVDGPSNAPADPVTDTRPGSWVVIPRPVPEAKMRLFCFPYAGGAASVFSTWPGGLPSEIEVCAIQPPGRHERLHEPLLESVEEMVAALIPALLPYLDRPFATFGHCLGAVVMFEALQQLAANHGLRSAHVFVSGAPSPLRYLVPCLTARSQAEFLELLGFIGFGNSAVLGDEDALRHLLPAVKADFDVATRYGYVASELLDAPITAFAGREDPLAPPDSMEMWRGHTSSWFSKIVFPGEHYFIVPERETLLGIMGGELLLRLAAIEQRRGAEAASRGDASATTSCVGSSMPRSAPRARLFCFPGVGSSSSVYESWPSFLGEDVEVCTIDLPGRGRRAHERALGHVEEIVEHVLPALRAHLDRPFAFFGLDVGAIVMFELARRLRREAGPLPDHLLVGAAMAPQVYYLAPMHHRPRERLLGVLRHLRVSLDESPLAEPALRAECAAMASYTFVEETPLDIPITAFIGERDSFVPDGGVRAWREQTTASFAFHTCPGGHDLPRAAPSSVLAVVREALSKKSLR